MDGADWGSVVTDAKAELKGLSVIEVEEVEEFLLLLYYLNVY